MLDLLFLQMKALPQIREKLRKLSLGEKSVFLIKKRCIRFIFLDLTDLQNYRFLLLSAPLTHYV